MSDTPCVDGCGQDAATIERLERSRAVAVRQLGEALGRAERAEAAIERARDALDSVGVLHPVAADRVLRALDGPQDAASAPEAPGQPGRGEDAADGDSGPCAAPSPMTGKPCQRLAGHERYAPQHWGPACGDEWEPTDARP